MGLLASEMFLASPKGLAQQAPGATSPAPSIPVQRVPIYRPMLPADNPETGENFVTRAVDQVGPAVVRIDAVRSSQQPLPIAKRTHAVRGSGSGFILSSDGLIVTNAHVVDTATTVQVTLRDGRRFTGTVLGRDSSIDLAVVRVSATNLPIVRFANSDMIRPGQWAIAIGNPLGLTNTVTVGVVSGVERDVAVLGEISRVSIPYIQTDVAINPGSSGGPLLNSRGEVIGINTAIVGGTQGLSFALPSNLIQKLSAQLIASTKPVQATEQAPTSTNSVAPQSVIKK